jgi:hypothetical protein
MVLGGGYYSYSLQKKRPWPLFRADPLLGHFHLIGSVRNNGNQNGRMGGQYGSETGVYEMDLAGEKFVFVAKIPPWNSSSCDPL